MMPLPDDFRHWQWLLSNSTGLRNFPLFTPHAQCERGKVIGCGVHIYIYIYMFVDKKKI